MPPRPSHPPLETTIDLGDRTAPLTARINRRARRLIVTVDAAAGRVFVTAPSKRALPEALDFARTRARWISAQLEEGRRAKPFAGGTRFPFRGAPVTIVNEGGPRSAVRLTEGALLAGGDPLHVNRRVTDWLKAEARKALTERADYYCERLGHKRGPITIRDTRSRWGSCARDGALSFSWRLIFAPPEILDYVAAHECAHLVHLNHSPAYWRIVKSLGVDARAARDWFEEHGQGLYAYGGARAA
ncbi:MAG: SprT family zinc-dependent metalloprotease [Pseudomonadota bacterium]